jgi:hypothetical protein
LALVGKEKLIAAKPGGQTGSGNESGYHRKQEFRSCRSSGAPHGASA